MWNNFISSFSANAKRLDNVTLWLGITVLIFIVYILMYRKNSKLPPGPKYGLPFFGYYFFLRKRPIEASRELAKKYGNVFGLYIGPKYVVFLNDWEAVKDGLCQNTALNRPVTLFEKVPYKFGFGGANGAEWIETRRLTSKVMKDGLQKNQWEDLIQKELSDMVDLIRKECGNPIEVRSFFRDSFSNNVISLLLGYRLEPGHPLTATISRSVDFIMENLQSMQMINFSEKLTTLLWCLGLEKIPPFEEQTRDFLKFVSDIVDSNAQNRKSVDDSFVSRFQEEIDNHKKNKEKSYATEDNLKGNLVTLMVAGNETTRTSIIWALIAMAEYPEKQKKVHEELDRVIGKDGSIRWSERTKIPYTLATLLESMRWKPTASLPAMRTVTEDTRIQGYHVPKGAFIVSNLWSVHNDPRYWEHPDQFIPERFLLEDGKKVNMSPDSFIPFSVGKRNCPGKLLALMDMLQYFSTLMQKFQVLPKEGDKVKYKAVLGLSYQARDVELRFIPR